MDKAWYHTDKLKTLVEYGYVADLNKLPIGTEFDVVNGAWHGKVVQLESGGKGILTPDNNIIEILYDGQNDFVIDEVKLPKNEELKGWIKLDNSWMNEEPDYQCPHCGSKQYKRTKFCPDCGKEINLNKVHRIYNTNGNRTMVI